MTFHCDLRNVAALLIALVLLGAVPVPTWAQSDQVAPVMSLNGAVYVWDTVTNQQVDYFLSSGVITSMEYSPFGGRLAVGTNPGPLEFMSPGRRAAPDTLKFVQHIPDSTVELFVPSPSIQDVEYIMEACNVAVEVRQAVTEPAAQSKRSALAAYIRELQKDHIPPGCIADLIAVAEALE